MGFLDSFTSSGDDHPRREEPYQPEEYGYDDFSDDVRVWIVDPWPSYKKLEDYGLMFVHDSALLDPVVLNCPNNIIIPGGTGILGYDEPVATPVQGTRFHVTRGILVHPHIVDFADIEGLFSMPQTMEGREIEAVDGTDSELVEICYSAWSIRRGRVDSD